MSQFLVLAEWQIRPGAREEVLALLSRLEEASRAEPGCVSFEGFVSRADPDRVTLVERYADREAFERHRASGHFRSLVLEGVVPLLAWRSVHGHVPVPL
ncbi:putative quinol monooxygenase [Streptomyces hoynatensis]|uniref:Antibiotic biosynthesis monooxygenase n=1 Tax=Streptomyces hoynatensis TaxID=1141874 RepID=A0A3A9Z6Y8_9ACTN|nr:putative quinol monooxygenase [Streptomyces hoynatensis]RKN44000.1 antibiotic biosynthesis monooxygenase [Streptomyces hoynatensis]